MYNSASNWPYEKKDDFRGVDLGKLMDRIPGYVVGWFVVAGIVLFFLCCIWTAIVRADSAGKEQPFRPMRGTVSLRGPVAIEEQDVQGRTRQVKAEKREINIRVKDSKGKVISETEATAKGRGK